MSHAELCPVCNGTGVLPCRGCNGLGWVTVHDYPVPVMPQLPVVQSRPLLSSTIQCGVSR